MNKRVMGAVYEQKVGLYLKEQGYELVESNFRCRMGEIDIIAKDGEYLVFIEVKYRRNESAGNPAEAVDKRKQRVISRVASFYCLTHGIPSVTPFRFDVVSVLGDEIRLIKNAFEYCGYF